MSAALEVLPVSEALGAEVRGADLARLLDGGTAAAIGEPPAGSCLYARELPASGGDTCFCSMTLACEATGWWCSHLHFPWIFFGARW